MSKGTATREAILTHAMDLATQVGLDGLSIGTLADDLNLSKSGLFAHFKSKEALQMQVLEAASNRFIELVIKPALDIPRGEPRVRALFERWWAWPRSSGMRGGCLFVAMATELDDRPGPVRDLFVHIQRRWMEFMAQAFRLGVEAGHFRSDLDAEQSAFELYGIMLGGHHATRLLADPQADQRTRRAFEDLLTRAKR